MEANSRCWPFPRAWRTASTPSTTRPTLLGRPATTIRPIIGAAGGIVRNWASTGPATDRTCRRPITKLQAMASWRMASAPRWQRCGPIHDFDRRPLADRQAARCRRMAFAWAWLPGDCARSNIPGRMIRIGLIGCGAWGRYILRDLKACGAVVHVADPADAARHNAAGQQADSIVDDFARLPAVDSYVVAAPSSLHARIIEALLPSGRPIFTEK